MMMMIMMMMVLLLMSMLMFVEMLMLMKFLPPATAKYQPKIMSAIDCCRPR